MKFTINREELARALRIVSGVVERKPQQSLALSGVLLVVTEQQLKVIATDQEIELSAMVPIVTAQQCGVALVPCRKLTDICRVLPEEVEIVFESLTEKTVIKAGQSKFVLTTLAPEQFPKLGDFIEQTSIIVPRLAFAKLLEKTAFAMAEQDVRYFLNGLLLEFESQKLGAVAADGHRLAVQTMACPQQNAEPFKIIIPRKGVLEILRVLNAGRAENISLTFAGTHFRVISDELSVTTALIAGKYPDYEKLIPRHGDKVMYGEREQFKAAITRASALLAEKFKGIRLRFTPGWLQILAYNTEKDEVEENLAIDFTGAEIELGFNAKYLLDFLGCGASEQVKMTFSEPNGSVLLEEVNDEQGLCLIMPMRM